MLWRSFFWKLKLTPRGGIILIRTARIVMCVLLAASAAAWSQKATPGTVPIGAESNPVAHARQAMSWHYGPFVNYGNGVGDRSSYRFLSGGVELGKPLTPVIKAGLLSGQFELAGNVMPLWQAYTPAPHSVTVVKNGITYVNKYGGGNYYGVSLTPVILRWNFLTASHRVQPWLQGAGGLIYTTHKFPPDVLVAQGNPGATSVWNFSPQGGLGLRYFVRPNRSIDLGVNAVHISSASIGDKNPGVNASMQFQIGYSYWK
jgi:lipid A 3-O-deacylase